VIAAGVVELAAQPLDVVLGGTQLLLQVGALGVAVLLMAVERRAGVLQFGVERAGARLVIAARVVELAAQPLDVVLGGAKLLLQVGALGLAVLLMTVECRAGVPQLGIERGRT
jgi:ABC-type uncharacterized transport system permease subunit